MSTLLFSRICLVLAIGLDVMLAWHSITQRPIAGCGGAEGCATVLGSSWAYLMGVPVSLLALATHALLLGFSFLSIQKLKSGWRRLTAIVLIGLVWMGAAWFVFIQAFILGHYCQVCLAVHALGSLGALFFFVFLPAGRERQTDFAGWGIALAGIVYVAGVQWLLPTQAVVVRSLEVPVQKSAGAERMITVCAEAPPVALRELPFIGDADAPLCIVVLFDFTCVSCRQTHPLLEEAVRKHPGRLCIVMLPVPIAPGCNKHIANLLPEHIDACDYARLGLALWYHNPDDFRAFCGQFIKPGEPIAPIAEARAWAENRIGPEALVAALADPRVERRLQWDVGVFASLVRSSGRLEMPKLVIGSQLISGAPSDFGTLEGWLQLDVRK